MSSGHWRTDKRIEPFRLGKTTNERAEEYVMVWKSRCYSVDIPDDVPVKVMKSNRAPSYHAIALAILRNDLQLLSLGFAPKESAWYQALRADMAKNAALQQEFIF